MTNNALQAMFDEIGDRICIIIFDNNSKVYIGYPSSTIKSVNDIELRTFGDTDMIGIPKKIQDPKLERCGATATSWHVTACIQMIATIDEGFERYRLDPMEIG